MKRKWTGIRITLSLFAAFGWWGLLYPELTLTPDTYAVVWEDDEADWEADEISQLEIKMIKPDKEMLYLDSEEDIYRRILTADSSRIRFKSRLFTEINALLKYLRQ